MRILITEDQYDFLKYAYKPRLDYIEEFAEDVQDMIDNNIESLLALNNDIYMDDKTKVKFTEITALIVDEDITLGIGNRAYDIKIWTLVKKSDKNWYFVNRSGIQWHIREMIKDKYGFKTSVQLELTLDPDESE